MAIFVAYWEGKEMIYKDNKLVYHPKNIPALSLSRTERAEASWISGGSQGTKQCEAGISNPRR